MNIVRVTTREQLKELHDSSAMTWEGLVESDFEAAMDACCAYKTDGTGYHITGKVMNELCGLTGDNAYPDNLNIFAIKNFVGLAMLYGARWMDDIIDNNARREGYHPFGTNEEE